MELIILGLVLFAPQILLGIAGVIASLMVLSLILEGGYALLEALNPFKTKDLTKGTNKAIVVNKPIYYTPKSSDK